MPEILEGSLKLHADLASIIAGQSEVLKIHVVSFLPGGS